MKIDTQKNIERNVVQGRDRENTARTPFDLRDTEIGLQIALANMDVCDGKMDMYDVIDFSSRLDRMLKRFDNAGIPYEVITDANGFGRAFASAYGFSKGKDIKPFEVKYTFEVKYKIS